MATSVSFGDIRLGIDHLTGPTGDDTSFQNTDAEHATARGKPQVQRVGSERDEKTFTFFFDEGFCDVAAERNRLLSALKLRTPAALNVPGRAFGGTLYTVDALQEKTLATTRDGRLVRYEATITLKEVPRGVTGTFATIGLAFAGRAGLGISVRR